MATITAQDGTGAFTTPIAVDGFESDTTSANVISELLNGDLAVTVLGDYARAGDLRLVFDDDTAAEHARELLARPTWFQFSAPERPALGFAFVRAGKLTAALHDQLRNLWFFDVGFQEVRP